MSTPHDSHQPSSLRQSTHHFFFAEEVPYGMAIVRILMPLALLIPMLGRWSHARELYSTDGSPAPLSVLYGHGAILPILPGGVIVAMMTLMVVFLFLSSAGFFTRFSLWGGTILFVYINLQDSISTMTKYSVIASHVLLLLSLSNCGAVWSVDAWLAERKRNRTLLPDEPTPDASAQDAPRFPVWPRRLVQLLIGIVYFGAAITKLHTPAYFNGDQLMFWMITHVNFEHPLGEHLALFPPVLVVFAYISVVWEILFVFLCWRGWGRISMLILGISFHLGTTLLLGLYVFPCVCIATYFAFLNEDDIRSISARFRLWRHKRGTDSSFAVSRPVSAGLLSANSPLGPIPAPALYAALLIVSTILGVEAEHWIDPYGVRRAQGPYTLKEVPRDKVLKMLAPSEPVRPEDRVFSFQLGRDMISGHLIGIKKEFRQGEVLVAQCRFHPPHGDMWVECNLHYADGLVVEGDGETTDGTTIDEVGQVVSREMNRGNWFYPLTRSFKPGEYYLALKVRGKIVQRKRFTILPAIDSPVSN